jgi:hypothetical protein
MHQESPTNKGVATWRKSAAKVPVSHDATDAQLRHELNPTDLALAAGIPAHLVGLQLGRNTLSFAIPNSISPH